MKCQQPYTNTPTIVNLVAEIGETFGRYTVLAIENNTLTLEQMTAVIEGRRVLGHPREIQKVRNAFATYEAMEEWDASSEEDLLVAHELLMRGLVDETDRYLSGGVSVSSGVKNWHTWPRPPDE